jgi:hypothetical protein
MLAGQTGPDNCPLLGLGQPLFYLSAAGQTYPRLSDPVASNRPVPIIIGQPEWRLWLEQWEEKVRQSPGRPVVSPFKNNFYDPEEADASWTRIKSWLRTDAVSADKAALFSAEEDSNVPDQAFLSFLLMSRLDAVNKDRQEIWRKFRQAQEALGSSLDNDGNENIGPELSELEPYSLGEERRMLIWARAAAETDLPAALWLMPRAAFLGWLNLWRPADAPEPLLSLGWSSAALEARFSLPPVRAALAALLARVQSYSDPVFAEASDFTQEVGAIDRLWPKIWPPGTAAQKLHLYILPAVARASLSLRPGRQAVLVWE